MTQQTALDWYMEKMNEYFDDASIHCGLYKEGKIYEQAKAMEKEQIIKAASNDKVFQIAKYLVDGEESNLSLFEWRNMIKRDAEQYYKENYNN